MTGDRDEFYSLLNLRRTQRGEPDREPEMGERFDFEDGAEMHHRLPRLATLYNWSDD